MANAPEARIVSYLHCKNCLETGKDQKLATGWTEQGLQIVCETCGKNILDMDFEGKKLALYKEEKKPHWDTDLTKEKVAFNNFRREKLDNGTTSMKDFYGTSGVGKLMDDINLVLNGKKGGFVMLHDAETGVVGGMYMGICKQHILEVANSWLTKAHEVGLIGDCFEEEEKERNTKHVN